MRSITILRHCEAEHNVIKKIKLTERDDTDEYSMSDDIEEFHRYLDSKKKKVKNKDNKDDQGRDSRLTEEGKRQASYLKGHYEFVLCSPLARCIETLENSNITYDYLQHSWSLREQILGLCDTVPGEISEIESFDSLKERGQNAWDLIMSIQSKDILVVTHAHLAKQLLYKSGTADNFMHRVLDNGERIVLKDVFVITKEL